MNIDYSEYEKYQVKLGSIDQNDNILSGSFVSSFVEQFNNLSNRISSKVFINDMISGIAGYNDISVVKLSANEYEQLVVDGNALSNCIYVVEKSFIDAYGEQIRNLASPTDLSDAATKKYVDDTASRLGTLSNDLAIQNFYNTLTSTTEGIDTIDVNTILSAVASLVKILGYNK